MTAFAIPRGQARGLWASLLPHAGKQSDDTPHFGRIRFAPGATELVAWTMDGATAAAGFVDVIDHLDGDAEIFDLSTAAVKAALAVFRGPSDKDARQMWEDQDLLVELHPTEVVFTEVGGLVEGRSLRVERVVVDGADSYPDVPRALARVGAPAATARALVSAASLAKFVTSANAWSGELLLTLTADPTRVEARVGTRLFGVCAALSHDDPAEPGPWPARMRPLVRPVTAASALREGVADVLRRTAGVTEVSVNENGVTTFTVGPVADDVDEADL